MMATLQPFKEGHHPEQYRVPSLDGKDRCKYTRQIFVQKGERVKNAETVKVSSFRQVAPGATLMYEDILYACDDDVCPEYTKDPSKSTPDQTFITPSTESSKPICPSIDHHTSLSTPTSLNSNRTTTNPPSSSTPRN